MGGKSTTTTNEPWQPAQPFIANSLVETQKLDSAGYGPRAWTGSTIVDKSPDTAYAVNKGGEIARGAMPAFQQNFNNISGMANDGGFNPLQQSMVDLLKPTAQGSELNGNPYLQNIIDMSARDMGNQINLQASGMGRTASGANQDVLARNIGDMSSNLRFQNYGNEQGRMDAARTSLFNAGQQQRSNVANGTNDLLAAFGAQNAPVDMLSQLGLTRDQHAQNQLNDQIRAWEDGLNKPLERQSMYNALYSGAGQLGSTSTQKQNTGGGEIAGGLLSLLGLF